MSDTSSLNIFKRSKKNGMLLINKLHRHIFYDNSNGNIIKKFLKTEIFDWEIYVLYKINDIKLDIVPEVINIIYRENMSSIEYDTSGLISLKSYLDSIKDFHYIINELISFLKNIKKHNILIGNLHIDSIYINITNMKFYLLDISNIIFKNQSLNENIDNIDIQSLYFSIDNNKIIDYFEKDKIYIKKKFSKYSYINNILDAYN